MSIAAEPAGTDRTDTGNDGVIRTVALTKVFDGRGGQVRAVEALDLEVHKGEVFGLLGPNGAGKTTTVGMLTTRVIPTSGEAWVGGIDVVAHPATAKRVIGVVPQTNTLDRSLDVAENLYFHGLYFGMNARDSHRRTAQLLEQFRLADRAKAGADELSGGMAQRLMVARAIMHEPDVLFLDEPTSGLDPVAARDVYELIGQLRGRGVTIFLTTHRLEEAERLCDRVAILNTTLRTIGRPDELRDQLFAKTLTVRTAAPLPDAGHVFVGLPGVDGWRQDDGQYVLTVTDPSVAAPGVTRALVAANADVLSISESRHSLEDVYLELVEGEGTQRTWS